MGDVLDRIRETGIIGAGGAGFPAHVKFSRPCEYIVLNGAECEPLDKSYAVNLGKSPFSFLCDRGGDYCFQSSLRHLERWIYSMVVLFLKYPAISR